MNKRIFIAVIFIVFSVYAHASTIKVAVKRGQQKVDASILPLACIAIATDYAALPIDTMTLEDLTTHKEYKARLSKTFGTSHPDLLTALSGTNRSISLAILHLMPGRYRVKSMEFIGPSSSNSISTITFDLTQKHFISFTVSPSCANYTGTLVLTPWQGIVIPRGSTETRFECEVTIEQTVERDIKWAEDVVPGMRSIPSVAALLEDKPEKDE